MSDQKHRDNGDSTISDIQHPISKQKILIVDDKKANIIALEKVLRDVDAEVIRASSGNEALKAVLNHDFALIITDVQMPGMDGYELATLLREDPNSQQIPITFVTASFDDEQHVFKGYEAGGIDYIIKPYAPEILVGKVKVFLEMNRHKRELQIHRDNLETLVAERTAELRERAKEQACLYAVSRDMQRRLPPDELCRRVVEHLIPAMHFPETALPVIELDGKRFTSEKHTEGLSHGLHAEITVAEEVHGHLWVYYAKEESFLLPEEQDLINGVAETLGTGLARKQAEEAVIISEQRLLRAQSVTKSGYMTWNFQSNDLSVSEGALRLYGIGPEVKPTMALIMGLVHPDDVDFVQKNLEMASKNTKDYDIDHRILRADGETIWVHAQGELEFDEKGAPFYLLGTVVDITQRKQLEEQSRQAQKLESIGTLAGGVAHEINNPVMGIMNYAQLILDKLGPDHEVAEYATEIGKETERVATIVKNLLSFARHDKQSHSPARMCDILEGTLSLIRAVMRHDQITLEVDVPEDLPEIKCRSQQIQQVVMNLLTNARDTLNEKYPGYDDGKTIIISASTIGDCGLRKEGKKEGGPSEVPSLVGRILRLTVEDHGAGIAEDVRERMFDPFYTTKPKDKGTGLGLSISHGIVKDHGGELSVESKVGEWTRFHVDLPIDNGWKIEDGEGLDQGL